MCVDSVDDDSLYICRESQASRTSPSARSLGRSVRVIRRFFLLAGMVSQARDAFIYNARTIRSISRDLVPILIN
jgi:hypothetical protein